MSILEVTPIYQRIAIDIANLIKSGTLKEGDTISGRSSLAGKYNVSPETIRRGLKVLEDIGVIKTIKGSGSKIISKENAIRFIDKHSSVGNLIKYKKNLISIFEDIRFLENEAYNTVTKIIDYSNRLQSSPIITPLEFKIPVSSHLVGKTLTETMFWQHTGGTVIGLIRNNQTIISPGPYIKFEKNDVIIVVSKLDQETTIEEFIKFPN
ncbi:MAG: TrkA C-terminal domain-containing protein [Clostridium sp.]|uniref:TrkA C-terminal domain-containing protein n=1 Tax=Clostridium sp. TaxID=1506 RepID=UPI002FC91DF8